jgi:phosphohistidine phosphatase
MTGTIQLVLVRHAKSDWGHADLEDHDRPLNERGRRDAPVMAARLARTGFVPDVILASTAVRAHTTAKAFAAELGIPVTLDADLYGAPADTLLAAAAATRAEAVLVVAHDPGMSELAARLSGGGIAHMPTCAVAMFTWRQDDWDVATALDADEWTIDTPH